MILNRAHQRPYIVHQSADVAWLPSGRLGGPREKEEEEEEEKVGCCKALSKLCCKEIMLEAFDRVWGSGPEEPFRLW